MIKFKLNSTFCLLAFIVICSSCKTDSQRPNTTLGNELSSSESQAKEVVEKDMKNNKSVKDLLIGTWTAVVEGDKIIWTVYSNGTQDFDWYHAQFTQTDVGEWNVEEDILYERYQDGGKTICKLKFETQDYLVLTVLDNGNPKNKNQLRHYHRMVEGNDKPKQRNNKVLPKIKIDEVSAGKQCSMPCPACNSQGLVSCNSIHTTPEDLRCVTQQRFADCMTEPNPGSKFYVCCRCYGTGVWKYKCN